MQIATPTLQQLARQLVRAAVLAMLWVLAGPAASALAEPPMASFLWFPPAPVAGEAVSLASTSTNATSPITGQAWDVAGDGSFAEGPPVISTTFATAGSHLVQLRVSAADGTSSVASETIEVNPAPLVLMEPFPIVRFVGSDDRLGAKLVLLSVEAPQGTEITINCRGRGCPVKTESQVAAAAGPGTATVTFRRFERALPAGLILEVRVSKSGEIGKYTRLSIRRRRAPARLDECLDSAGTTPIQCPS